MKLFFLFSLCVTMFLLSSCSDISVAEMRKDKAAQLRAKNMKMNDQFSLKYQNQKPGAKYYDPSNYHQITRD